MFYHIQNDGVGVNSANHNPKIQHRYVKRRLKHVLRGKSGIFNVLNRLIMIVENSNSN